MTRVLITGGTGVLGRALARSLSRVHEVWTTSRRDTGDDRHVAADLTADDAARAIVTRVQPNMVVHLAGTTRGSPPELFDANVVTTVNLLQAVDPSTPVIAVGSAAEYGPGTGDLIAETAPLRPVSEYGRSKAAGSLAATAIARRRGIPLTIVRPFNVVGPEMPTTSPLGNIGAQLRAAQGTSTDRLRTGRLDVVRDFIPIGFVVEALTAVVADPQPDGVFNICSGVGLRLRDVVEALAGRLGVAPEICVDPDLAALPAAERVVGDPARLTTRYGISVTTDPERVADAIVGTAQAPPAVPSARPTDTTTEDR